MAKDKHRGDFGEYIFKLRMDKGVTMEEASRRIGVSKQYISYLERSMKIPSDPIIYEIANYYNVGPEVLFGLLRKIPDVILHQMHIRDECRDAIEYIASMPPLTKEENQLFFQKLQELYQCIIENRGNKPEEGA